MLKTSLFALLIILATKTIQAQVQLPSIVRDSMILQRDAPVKIWGWASPREKIRVKFIGKTFSSTTNSAGHWEIKLPPVGAGGPYTMHIEGKNKITIRDILFGDVWFCSGQSNMVHQMNIHDVTYAKDIEQANFPTIRQFLIPTLTNLDEPQNNYPAGHWQPAIGNGVRPFSAVAYFFARKIHEKYDVPVGIINASVGGTPIEAWISEQGVKQFPELVAATEKNKDTAYINASRRRAATSGTRTLPPEDAGMTSTIKWFDTSYFPVNWRTINIPGYWEDQGLKDLNGTVWYRREIEIPSGMSNKPATVFLGRIVDADELYINGKEVGRTSYQYPQRRYKIPAGVLKPGKNIVVVRVTNTSGKGGFVPDKPYCIFAENDTIDLKGYWTYKVGRVFKPASGGGFGGVNAQNQPAALYNAMVAPAIHYPIRGICWYQGESNAARPAEYGKLMEALISDWRSKWKADSLPFLYVQLPGFMDFNYLPSESNWALLRESQLNTLAVPNTAMAVAIDLGEWNDIHPDNKKDVGERLAIAAMKVAYNENIVYSGPLFKEAKVQGDTIQITFTNTGTGIISIDGEALSGFSIAASDKKFVWAEAKIVGNVVHVWSREVRSPKYVRYAWADNPVNPNLFNREGLPASPFRTDK